MKPVVIHHDADDDLDEAIAYYEKQKRGLGLDLETEVRQAIGRIRQEPQRGSKYKATPFRFHLVQRFPYVIYYADLEEVIWIMAVAHGRRRPGYWRRRRPH